MEKKPWSRDQSSVKPDDWEKIGMVLNHYFIHALEKFDRKNENLLKRTSSPNGLILKDCLFGMWLANFRFYWRKVQLEEALGHPIEEIDGSVNWLPILKEVRLLKEIPDELNWTDDLLSYGGGKRQKLKADFYANWKEVQGLVKHFEPLAKFVQKYIDETYERKKTA